MKNTLLQKRFLSAIALFLVIAMIIPGFSPFAVYAASARETQSITDEKNYVDPIAMAYDTATKKAQATSQNQKGLAQRQEVEKEVSLWAKK